jgi:hypothetical protein
MLRIHLNIIPLLFFINFVFFISKKEFSGVRTMLLFILTGALLEFLYWIRLNKFNLKSNEFNHTENLTFFPIDLEIFHNSALLIVINSLILLCFVIVRLEAAHILLVTLFSTVIFSLSIVFFLHHRQLSNSISDVSNSTEAIESYYSRWGKWKNLADISNPNFRVLPAGAPIRYNNRGGNYKTLLDTELNRQMQYSAIFSYREVSLPTESLFYSLLKSRDFQFLGNKMVLQSNFMPPTIDQMIANESILQILGVTHVSSADSKIISSDFSLLDDFDVTHSSSIEPDLSGNVYLYKFNKAKPLAWSGPTPSDESLVKCNLTNPEENIYGWLKNYIIIDDVPLTFCLSEELSVESPDLIQAEVRELSPNKILVELNNRFDYEYVFLSFINRPLWSARVNEKTTKIHSSYYGFMAIPVAPGTNLIELTYEPIDVYIGYILTVIILIYMFLVFIKVLISDKMERPS